MSTAEGGRACPGCGAVVGSQYCPHCGAKVMFTGPLDAAGAPGHRQDADDAPTVPSMPVVRRAEGPVAVVPEMFPTEMVPTAGPATPQAWSQAPDPTLGPQTGLFPGWTGMYPAVATAGAVGALAPRPERRRRAIYAVLGIAAVTVLVLVAALLIAPHLGGSNDNTADKNGQPAVSGGPSSGASSSSAESPTMQSPTTGPQSSAPVVPVSPVPATTVTVTASSGTAVTARSTSTAPKTTAKATPTTTPTKPKPTPKPTPKSTPKPTPTTVAQPLGVPEREIACNPGYVVQLASELDKAAFVAHVARLKSSGQLPAGSLAADSTRSCKIFTSQVNTLVLYSGPYSGKYDGCAARLAGPADAYIKGSNPDNARDYISCLCPANTAALPQYTQVGEQGVWIGEAQRILGNRLNVEVSDLSGQWGIFTPGTRAAIQQFQKSARIPANGNLDLRTWQAMHQAQC